MVGLLPKGKPTCYTILNMWASRFTRAVYLCHVAKQVSENRAFFVFL
ncbi:hypothetical protein Krac_6875 [Ktedonobacter racemifer DSM 44963]|uniref:Uncharacterized protein n=1 Tax=Ktedonobacter racemifer DSM 44963 TaxID=485913 RepID=D6TPN4_KTERA|nr:hypothetical protein Krac_6875 [Ktedonobacter racemifer DSM 44963]